jgi:ATP-dependent Lhr-like helicase
LLNGLRRLEDRGDVRGGRFVSGFIGEQFALPIAVDSLRAARHRAGSDVVVVVSAADPLNLAGIVVPGDRVPATAGRTVTFRNGAFVPPGVQDVPVRQFMRTSDEPAESGTQRMAT